MTSLPAVDNLFLYDPRWEHEATHFVGSVGGTSAPYPIASMKDLTAAGSAFSNVKLVIFDTHGIPGMIVLATARM
jgi:hypothetical protein